MNAIKRNKVITSFEMTNRMEKLAERSHELAKANKRDVYVDNPEFLVYHWSGQAETFSPATGEQANNNRINIGDHNCRVDVGTGYPFVESIPSKVNGLELNAENWAKDYAYFLTHSPAEIYENESIVGEFHWQLDEARLFKYPDYIHNLGFEARKLGAGGISFTHTCPDLRIGLDLGWDGLLEKVKINREKFKKYGNKQSVDYLNAAETVTLAIIKYIESYAIKAEELAKNESDVEQKERYEKIAVTCSKIAHEAPSTYYETVQWIQLFQIVERINGHGNGYGRLDQYLIEYYRKDIKEGILTKDEAREYIAELYLKYGGNYFSFGGRDYDGNDFTNEVSWIGVEAYDMVGGYTQLGVMRHPDINKDFFEYACDVVGRHGCGAPTLVNYDVFRDSELRSGYSYEDAWNVSYSGCQWYCAVGSEYSDHDLNSYVIIQPMQRAIDRSIEAEVEAFEDFFKIYDEECHKTAEALVKFKNEYYKWQPKVWPEIVTSLCMHGPIENGKDVTDSNAVNNNFTSVNVLGMPNLVDSIYAIDQLVFRQKKYSLKRIRDAVAKNWEGEELLRSEILALDKFGNAISEVDRLAVFLSEHIRELLESKRNIKGFNFRPSLFQYMGHTYAGDLLGATPDGRKAEEPFAHGMNPMHGRNKQGIAATMESFTSIDFRKYQGGSFQVELEPTFFGGREQRGEIVMAFAKTFFQKGGVQINLNVIDLDRLKKAMDDPTNPEYQDIVVKVTGYSAHFLGMDRRFQEEFIARVNYQTV
jgi:formate C-acetyltransferase